MKVSVEIISQIHQASSALVVAEKALHDSGDFESKDLDEATGKITDAMRILERFLQEVTE
tara:strand:- start:139 stop:318 length:180 start_codon:yes stop_codon:yes gene_type:complete